MKHYNITDISYEERYDDEEYNTTTFYFVAPKEQLDEYIPDNDYTDAVCSTIALEAPTGNFNAKYSKVCISPSREIDGGMEDYDWNDINMDFDMINTLFMLADV